MATAYVQEGAYCASDYCEVEVVTAPTSMAFPTLPPGQYPIATPEAGRVTLTESPPTADYPRGPYGMVLAVVLTTHAGDRIFSQVHVDPIYTVPPALARQTTLMALDPITLSQGGSSSTLVTRINSLERVSFTVRFDNSDGFWSQLIASEALLCMTVSLYQDLGDGVYTAEGRGIIQDIELVDDTCVLHVGA